MKMLTYILVFMGISAITTIFFPNLSIIWKVIIFGFVGAFASMTINSFFDKKNKSDKS